MTRFYQILLSISILLLVGCSNVWNNPYPDNRLDEKALFLAFSEQPKHLDPAKSYSSNEWVFVQSVYDSPLQYHYLKRPYTLEPNVVSQMPKIIFYDKDSNILAKDTSKTIAYSDYFIDILPDVFYQQHQAFVPDNLNLNPKIIADINQLSDIKKTATRELVAADFIHQIKRLAHPNYHSPILSVMKDYIVGMDKFSQQLLEVYQKGKFLDLSQYNLSGVKKIGKYQYRIRIQGHQPQFIFWLAMPFFTAIAPEADKFYFQKGLKEKNISLDWYPVGTGAFYLSVNNPNKEMVLSKNPNFRQQTYPVTGSLLDKKQGLLDDAGQLLPLVDNIYFSLERESIPYWHKFLQGYYDKARVGSEYFDQALSVEKKGEKTLSAQMKNRNIFLSENEGATIYWLSFNMLDEDIGHGGKKNKLLRQAISIAIDMETYVSIFLNGEASIAQHPIPKGFFGFNNNKNNLIYNSDGKRKTLTQAKVLLTQAGFKNGINPKTNKPLTLSFNTTDIGPGAQSRLTWLQKQFNKLGINLLIEATNYSTFLDKISQGKVQLFESGWGADYPDAENFLFLFYSQNSKVKYGGDNSSNYDNKKFDELFLQMKNMNNTPLRAQIINQMIQIWQEDNPWAFAYVPNTSLLTHSWVNNVRPNALAKNTLKYQKVNVAERIAYQQKYNQPNTKPLWIFIGLLTLILVVIMRYKKYNL